MRFKENTLLKSLRLEPHGLKGGTGWFDITKSNQLLQWGLPIGLTSLLGMGLLNNNNEKEYQN